MSLESLRRSAAYNQRLDQTKSKVAVHESHDIHSSDASSFDIICHLCGRTDGIGTFGKLGEICPKNETYIEEMVNSGYDPKTGDKLYFDEWYFEPPQE